MIVQYVLTIFITIYFYRIYHLSLAKSAYLFFVSQASGALGRIILAAWSDHCRKGRFFSCLVLHDCSRFWIFNINFGHKWIHNLFNYFICLVSFLEWDGMALGSPIL